MPIVFPLETPKLKVAISGGGPAGLAAAIAFLKLPNVDVTIYEQATELREIGGGIRIGYNSWRVLELLGVADKVDGHRKVDHQHRIRRSGHWGRRYSIGEFGLKVVLMFKAVKSSVFPAHETTWNGTTIWRCLIPLSMVDHLSISKYTAFHRGPNRMFKCSVVSNDDEVARGEGLWELTLRAYNDPITKDKKFSWGVPCTNERVADHFRNFTPEIREAIDKVPKGTWKEFSAFSGPRLGSVVASGNIALIGDASHPLLVSLIFNPLSQATTSTHPEWPLTLDSVSIPSLIPSSSPTPAVAEKIFVEAEILFDEEDPIHVEIEESPVSDPAVIYVPYAVPTTSPSAFLHPITLFIFVIAFLGFVSTLASLPFSLMSSSAKPSSSSSSSSSKPSSSSSSSKPSSSSSSSSSSTPKPSSTTPYISPNAWMSFFLFCCLVLIILQGPLGLTGNGLPGLPVPGGLGLGLGGMPGCAGLVNMPWCQGQVPQQQPAPIVNVQTMNAPVPPPYQPMPAPYQPVPQMGGQASYGIGPHGGQYSWYATSNPYQPQLPPQPAYYPSYPPPRPPVRNFQYQRPGFQMQVNSGGRPGGSNRLICHYQPWLCRPLIPFAHAQTDPGPSIQVQHQGPVIAPPPRKLPLRSASAPELGAPSVTPVVPVSTASVNGLANLENAFYPLLVGAIALLVIFDYAG
ncbi:hypothetical protein P7C73_g1471, partial [Tremellales sp. Uapishka_1]